MGCLQEQIDPDVLYASTPTLVSMRLLLLMATARNRTISTCSHARHCVDRAAERVLPKPRLSLEIEKGYVWPEASTSLMAITLPKCHG